MTRAKLLEKTNGTAFECKKVLGMGCGKNPETFRASLSLALNIELYPSEAASQP